MPYLNTLVHSTAPFMPTARPSTILIPSLHSPSGEERDFSPALAVAFNPIAKLYDADSARHSGQRRLLAVAADEGGIRIVDVDEEVGSHREEKGWWWRGHRNMIYEVKWSADGTQMVSAKPNSRRLGSLTDVIESADSCS